MTKIKQMQSFGIPVIESQTDEASGSYAFSEMTQDQRALLNSILAGYPVSISTDSNIMIGNGADEITLSVKGEPGATLTINVMTGETPSTLDILLDSVGNGLQVFSCETNPTKIVFSHGIAKCEVRAL